MRIKYFNSGSESEIGDPTLLLHISTSIPHIALYYSVDDACVRQLHSTFFFFFIRFFLHFAITFIFFIWANLRINGTENF